jgi:hypothetical protein
MVFQDYSHNFINSIFNVTGTSVKRDPILKPNIRSRGKRKTYTLTQMPEMAYSVSGYLLTAVTSVNVTVYSCN